MNNPDSSEEFGDVQSWQSIGYGSNVDGEPCSGVRTLERHDLKDKGRVSRRDVR